MERRNYIKSIGAIGTGTLLAGCTSTKAGAFKLMDIGLHKRKSGIAAYGNVKNTTQRKNDFNGMLAVYSEGGTRVSEWIYISDYILSNETRRFYAVFDSDNAGWLDSNNLGQVIDAHQTKLSDRGINGNQTGTPMNESNVGEMIDRD